MKTLFISLLLPFTLNAYSQPFFSSLFENNQHGTLVKRIEVLNDTVFALGLSRDYEPPGGWCVFLMRLDTMGTLIDSTRICDPNGGNHSVSQIWSDFQMTMDSGFIITAFEFENYDPLFIKLDRHLNLELYKILKDSISLNVFCHSGFQFQNSYYFGGQVQRPNLLNDGFLRKLDLQGNTLWYNFYGTLETSETFQNCFASSDSTLMCVGGHYLTPNDPYTLRPWIVEMDSSGSILHEYHPTDDVGYNAILDIFPIQDGNWLINGRKVCEDDNGSDSYCTILGVLDPNFNLLKSIRVGSPEPNTSFLQSFDRGSDGINIIGSGLTKMPDSLGANLIDFGWIVSFTSEGDTLWTRKFSPPTPEFVIEAYLSDVAFLSSGNIIALGSVRVNFDYYYWIVKVSEDGCIDTLDCGTVSLKDLQLEKDDGLRIYPNPTHSNITLKFLSSDQILQQTARFYIFNSLGQEVWKGSTAQTAIEADLTGLSSGIYIAKVELENWSSEKVFFKY